MPDISTPEGSPRRRWALGIPGIRSSGSNDRLQFTGGQPEWFTTGFGLGYIGVAHAVQAKCGLNGTLVSLALYSVCVVFAGITGRFVRRLTDRLLQRGAKADRIPRIFGAVIVLGGMCVGALPGTTAVPAAAPHWTAQLLPVATGALLVVLAIVGEALVCWFPADQPAPTVPTAPVPARRTRWFRLRPDAA
ncbi:hypothetical protein OG905_07350 [Streptomyces sp. NBC_00322]|uniref:hypothetical protein n=1 Tax=Streptomyces sp. NBC_00322 TaxID=2975712 RepID=UPI002E2DBB3A|nr:hypothetical protein [Streptomyces sp. NBC_00322]